MPTLGFLPFGWDLLETGHTESRECKYKPMHTIWLTNNELKIDPPNWESALYFLDTFTYLDTEFGTVDLAATGMFDLLHPATEQALDLPKSLRAIRQKTSLAKLVLGWIIENRELLGRYPQDSYSQQS